MATNKECCYTPENFPCRSGTHNLGSEYEYKTGILLFLRNAVRKDTTHIWMMLNANCCGAFDDVLLYRRTKNRKAPILYMIQLKHAMAQNDIKAAEFKTYKKNKDAFYLQKYFDSITKMIDVIDGRVTIELQKGDDEKSVKEFLKFLKNEKENIVFILYTNRSATSGCDFLQNVSKDSCLLKETIDVNGLCSRLLYNQLNYKHSKEVKPFLEKFFLLTKQMHINALEQPIKDAFKQFIQPVKLNDKNLTELVEKFHSFIVEWAGGLLGDHFPLTRMVTLKKITEILLEPYTVNLKFDSEKEIAREDIWNDFLKNKDVVIVEDPNGSIEEFLAISLVNSCKSSCCAKSTDLKEIRVVTLKSIKENFSHQEVYEFLWKSRRLPLIVEVTSEDSYKILQDLLKLINGAFKVIVLNKSNVPWNDRSIPSSFTHLGNLDKDQQNIILNIPVRIQGRKAFNPLVLKDLITTDEEIAQISTTNILEILTDQFSIGNDLESLPDVFVERTILPILLDVKVLKKPELFLIETASVSLLRAYTRRYSLEIDENCVYEWQNGSIQPRGVNVILFKTKSELDEIIASLKCECFHILTLPTFGYLEWLDTVGTTKNLRKFRLVDRTKTPSQCLNWDFEINDFEQTNSPKEISDAISLARPTIISGSPGTGKTVLRNHIALNAPTSLWVLKINLSIHKEFYKTFEATPQVLECFLKETFVETKSIDRTVFENHLQRKAIFLLLDGFDEIPVIYQKKAADLLKYMKTSAFPMLVTTRSILKFQLETALDAFSLEITPLTKRQQHHMLSSYFSKTCEVALPNHRISLYTEKLLSESKRNLNDNSGEFSESPMQIYLLANVFKNYCKQFLIDATFQNKHFDLTFLYKTFIDEKIKEACKKPENISEDMIHHFRAFKSLYALRLLFSDDELKDLNIEAMIKQHLVMFPDTLHIIQKDGIVVVESENVIFVHRSFAEYLAAEWLANNLHTHREVVRNLIKITFTDNLMVTRNSFDRILSESLPLHSSIIRKRTDCVREIVSGSDCTDFTKTDDAGRTFLHMIASWGLHHPLHEADLQVADNYMHGDEMLKILKLIPRKWLRITKDELFGYTPLDYAILSGSLKIANALCGSSNNQFITLPNVDEDYLNNYSNRFGYTCLSFMLAKRCVVKQISYLYVSYCTYYYSQLQEDASDNHSNILFKVINGQVFSFDEYKEKAKIFETTQQSLLHVAVLCDKIELVKIIMDFDEESLNIKDATQKTPLHWAVIRNNYEIVQLLAPRCQVEAQDRHGLTPLHYATIANLKDPVKIIKILLDNRANPENGGEHGCTPFSYALHLNKTSISQLFLESVEITEVNSTKMMHYCCCYGQFDLIDLYLSKGANIEGRDEHGLTILMRASFEGQTDVVEYLLAQNADIEAKSNSKRTALHWAAIIGHTEVGKLLLANGAQIDTKDDQKMTALHWATQEGRWNFVNFLLVNGANFERTNKNSHTALHLAAIRGHADVAELLLSAGARIEAKDETHFTPLHQAAGNGHTAVIELLLSLNANLHAKDVYGSTALHIAAANGQLSSCEMLVLNGADLEVKDALNGTPLLRAISWNQVGAVRILLKLGADPNTACESIPALHIAASQGETLIVAELVKYGANVEQTDDCGRTAIIFAAQRGEEFGVFSLLLEKANYLAVDNEGLTALDWARQNGHEKVVELLEAEQLLTDS